MCLAWAPSPRGPCLLCRQLQQRRSLQNPGALHPAVPCPWGLPPEPQDGTESGAGGECSFDAPAAFTNDVQYPVSLGTHTQGMEQRTVSACSPCQACPGSTKPTCSFTSPCSRRVFHLSFLPALPSPLSLFVSLITRGTDPSIPPLAGRAPRAPGCPHVPIPPRGPSAGSSRRLQPRRTLPAALRVSASRRVSAAAAKCLGRGAKSGRREINLSSPWLCWGFALD